MDKKSKVLIGLFLALIVAVSAWKYQVYFEDRDFVVYGELSCDPAIESCFVSDCDPEEDEECDLTPYKKIERIASGFPACENPGEGCDEAPCAAGEEGCIETVCSEDVLEDGEVCSEPVVAQAEPVEEDDTEESETEEGENATSSEATE